MDLNALFAAIDAKPFRPFTIALTSGDHVEVKHPDNIFALPSRLKVHNIQIYDSTTWQFAIVYPEAVAAILFTGSESPIR